MTFYINKVRLPESDWHTRCIGLFDSNKWDGRGSFCGYYGSEYYLDTTLLVYGVQLNQGGKPYDPKAPFEGGIYEAYEHYDEIMIGSGLWEQKIEADSVEEAVDIFITRSWR